MLDGILGRGFASKCKSLIKVIKSRIDVIRRKKSATIKFLKKDIADLLANGLDINAYGRVEGYIAELVLSSCYDFVEKCCDFVSKHASVMQKLSDCPEDCREAVSSLMFAAARFSDLPELRDLRQIFHDRYGSSLELFVNKQLVENSTSNPSTMEKKIKVMHDIASEFSIKWDSEAFERRMSKPTVIPQDQLKSYGSFHVSGDKHKSNDGTTAEPLGNKPKVSSKEKFDVGRDGNRLHNHKEEHVSKPNDLSFPPKQEFSVEGFKPHHGREEPLSRNGKDDALKTAKLSGSSHGKRMERIDVEAKLQDDREIRATRIDNLSYATPRLKSPDKHLFAADDYAGQVTIKSSSRKTREEDEAPDKHRFAADNNAGQVIIRSSTRKTLEEDKAPDKHPFVDERKPYFNSSLPPPYVKPNVRRKDHRHGVSVGSSCAGFDSNGVSGDKSYAVNGTDKYQEGLHHPDKEGQVIPPTSVNGWTKEYYSNHDESDAPIPRRRSSRRRHSKSASDHIEVNNVDDAELARRKPRSRRRDDSRRGLQILFDDEQHKNDEEERIIDKLLMHYSKKPSSCEEGKLRRKSKSRHAHHMGSELGEAPEKGSRDRSDDTPEAVPRPARSISLPPGQAAQPEGTKVYARATSFQQDRSNAARHVHPKLPDYDDLAAHFAAMKGR